MYTSVNYTGPREADTSQSITPPFPADQSGSRLVLTSCLAEDIISGEFKLLFQKGKNTNVKRWLRDLDKSCVVQIYTFSPFFLLFLWGKNTI